MFFVFQKERMISYMVAISTVTILIGMAMTRLTK